MLAFEVSVNGQKLHVAAAPEGGVLATGLSWSHRQPETIIFNLGGVAGDGTNDHLRWPTPQIQIGDEILMRVVDVEFTDSPQRYQPK